MFPLSEDGRDARVDTKAGLGAESVAGGKERHHTQCSRTPRTKSRTVLSTDPRNGSVSEHRKGNPAGLPGGVEDPPSYSEKSRLLSQ